MTLAQNSPWLEPALISHAQLLLSSFQHLTGKSLLNVPNQASPQEIATLLFNADFVVVSHGTQADPVLNYGNQAALNLWKMDWHRFTQTPSRYTAEPIERSDRQKLLAQAQAQGYIDNYRGIRIASNGDRFYINQAIIWNLIDQKGTLQGQAATFKNWEFLDMS